MSDRAVVYQNVNFGVETVKGTAVAIDKRMQNTYIEPTPDAPVRMYRSIGSRFPVDATAEKEMSTFRYEGAFGFNDLTYILSSLLGVDAGGGAGAWEFVPLPFAENTVQTYTFGIGKTGAAEGFSYGVFNSLLARFSKTEAVLSGDGFGQIMDEAPTIGAVTDIKSAPASPKKVSIYLADTEAGLAAGKLTRCLEIEWFIRNMYGQLFALNEATESFETEVDLAPEMGFNVVLSHNSVSKALMADMRALEQKFARIIINGKVIGAGPGTYSCQVTMPVMITDPSPADQQNVVGRRYVLNADYESGLASAIEVVLANEVTAL